MAYNKTVWINNEEPSIDADNLNKMEQGIYDAQYPDGGTTGQLLSKTATGQEWVDAPNSAVWGLIQGTLSDQTDLQAALDDVGNVDTVNGIQPDTNKNVEVDVELTKAEYDALPSSKLTDDVNYWIKDGTNLPQTSVISADGVMYTDSQTVKGALDSQASAISDLNNDLASVNIASVTRIATTATTGSTGNIALPYSNDGRKYVVAPFALQNSYLRAWVAQANNSWYLTAVNPNTGATINNTSLDIRYLLITLKSA